jgi:hypothetical protein
MILFHLNSVVLVVVVAALVLGAMVAGWFIGRSVRHRSDTLREGFAVLQAALLGFMALLLAFGLSLAVNRHEARRGAVVTEANAIGTTHLRAQTLPEPVRTGSLDLLERFADQSIRISRTTPNSGAQDAVVVESSMIERQLWALAGEALDEQPDASAPRLYVESLNEMFDAQTARVAGLDNRVPTPVIALELIGASLAVGMLALHLAVLGRGAATGVVAAALVSLTLLVTFDLDRPRRGLIAVPATALVHARAAMELPPAASAPGGS